MSTAATKAAEEAASGTWLKELESGKLPRITAPGLTQGWFGPWETAPDDETNLEKQTGNADCNGSQDNANHVCVL